MADLLAPFAGPAAPQLASQLRSQFGSLARALSAPRSQWRPIEEGYGQVCDLIFAARDLVDAARHEQLQSTVINSRDPEFLTYLRTCLCRSSGESLLVVFCDNEGKYLIDEKMGWGSAHNIRLDMAHLFRRALALDAASLVLAHNHPSGNCQPSEDDIVATRKLAEVGHVLGVEVVDHLIVTRDKAYSMRAGGKF
ncbi:JAB domain-containing protein [Pontixanthobacter aestiaquae]|nr:JAB domain-containing protein [Pontixanthobacter aestiaquae]MDN3646446.1 JAB domain-containing protein [Pontixanthobacter aestiaquae]